MRVRAVSARIACVPYETIVTHSSTKRNCLQPDFGGVTRYVSTCSASDEVKASFPCGSAEIVNPLLIEIPATLGQGTGQRFPAESPQSKPASTVDGEADRGCVSQAAGSATDLDRECSSRRGAGGRQGQGTGARGAAGVEGCGDAARQAGGGQADTAGETVLRIDADGRCTLGSPRKAQRVR